MFNSVKQAIFWIENIKRKSKRQDLSRMIRALNILNNPQNSFKKIHVAGTNGKGSTVSFIKNTLINLDYKVGSFISPYVISFNERFQLNNELISNEDIIKYANIIYKLQEDVFSKEDDTLTFFEILTLMMILYFKDAKVDYAIIEVGLGGLLDATNAINYDLSLITNIGYDHMNALGNCLEEIALNKLGILKNGNHLITTVDESLYDLFKNTAIKANATVDFINTKIQFDYLDNKLVFDYLDNHYELNLLGNHQVSNALLAINALYYLFPNMDNSILKRSIDNTFWPGRFEVINKRKTTIVIDGAHNINGIESLCESLKKCYKDKLIKIVFTALKDKELAKMIDLLDKYAFELILTSFDDARAVNPYELYKLSNSLRKVICSDINDVLGYIKKTSSKNEIVVFCGSLHYVSSIRNKLKRM